MIVRNTSNTCKKKNIYRFSGEYRPYLVHWRGPDCMKARKRSWYTRLVLVVWSFFVSPLEPANWTKNRKSVKWKNFQDRNSEVTYQIFFSRQFFKTAPYPINLQWFESRSGKACGWVMRHPKRTSKETRLVRTYLLELWYEPVHKVKCVI
jgi:hypothetical protein